METKETELNKKERKQDQYCSHNRNEKNYREQNN